MSTLEEVFVSDPWLESQFTQVELRKLKSKFNSARNESGTVKIKDLPPVLEKLKPFNEVASQDEITRMLGESYCSLAQELCFEAFLRVYLNIQCRASGKLGTSKNFKTTSSLVKSSTTTLPHSISETEKVSYVYHINNFLGQDNFLKDFLPLDPTTNALFDLAKDGVLLCKLINIAVPGTIDARAINTKKVLYPWERNENHILCLNSAKVIGCTVANIDTQDLAEGKPHVLLELISQIIKIKLLADVDIKKTPELAEIVEDSKEAEELMGLASEKVLLKWMNYQLKKSVYTKEVTNFSSDLKDGEAYAHLLNALAPEHGTTKTLEAKDPTERANLIIEHAEKLGCKTYVTSKDIVEGCTNLNLAFVAQIFHNRNGLEVDKAKSSFAKIMSGDESTSRKNQRYFRMWNNSLGVETHVNNVWEDVRNGSTLLSSSVGQLKDYWKNTFSLCCGSDRFYQKL